MKNVFLQELWLVFFVCLFVSVGDKGEEVTREPRSACKSQRPTLGGVRRDIHFYIVKTDTDKNVKQLWPPFVGGREVCFSKRRTLWSLLRKMPLIQVASPHLTALEPCRSVPFPYLQQPRKNAAAHPAERHAMWCFSFHMLLGDTQGMDWESWGKKKKSEGPQLALSPTLCYLAKAQPPKCLSTSSNAPSPPSRVC